MRISSPGFAACHDKLDFCHTSNEISTITISRFQNDQNAQGISILLDFWRIPLASQPPSQPWPARRPRPARQPVTAGQPATVSQPASAPNRHWITFSTKLLPEVQNRPLLPMRFFNHSIVEYRWPASQPADPIFRWTCDNLCLPKCFRI